MKFNLEMPIAHGAAEPEAVVAIAEAAERNGIEGIAYTDHPAPSKKWLDGGGHQTFDPFAALAFCAGVTRRVRLVTYLAVLPYRNPLLLAKAAATVDRLSGGRLTLVTGSGYLRSEFAALGRSFDERNALTDEALEVFTTAFGEEPFHYTGRDFTAVGQVIAPGPVQRPHPPVWVGGNSRKSRERAVRYGAGWAPLFTPGPLAATVRTASIATLDDMAAAIGELRALAEREGRDPASLGVQCDGLPDLGAAADDPDAFLARVAELEAVGVTHGVVHAPGGAPPDRVVASIEAFGAIAARAVA